MTYHDEWADPEPPLLPSPDDYRDEPAHMFVREPAALTDAQARTRRSNEASMALHRLLLEAPDSQLFRIQVRADVEESDRDKIAPKTHWTHIGRTDLEAMAVALWQDDAEVYELATAMQRPSTVLLTPGRMAVPPHPSDYLPSRGRHAAPDDGPDAEDDYLYDQAAARRFRAWNDARTIRQADAHLARRYPEPNE